MSGWQLKIPYADPLYWPEHKLDAMIQKMRHELGQREQTKRQRRREELIWKRLTTTE